MITTNRKIKQYILWQLLLILTICLFHSLDPLLFAFSAKQPENKGTCLSLLESERSFIGQVTHLCEKIRDSRFTEIDPKKDSMQKKALLSELDQLEQYIRSKTDETNAVSWMKYLEFQEMRAVLHSTDMKDNLKDMAQLKSALSSFNSGESGLEQTPFVQFKENLSTLVREKKHLEWTEQERKDFEEVCTRLPKEISELLLKYDQDLAEIVALSLTYLKVNSRISCDAETLINLVQQRFSIPNVQVAFSSVFLSQESANSFAESIKVAEIIRGSQVYGSGTVNGNLVLEYVPNEQKAEIKISLDALMNTRTTAFQRGVQVHSSNAGNIRAEKSIYFDKQLTASPAKAAGRLSSRVTDIFSGHFVMQMLGLIQHRVEKERPYSEDESRKRMEIKMAKRLDEEVDSRILPTQIFLDTVINEGFKKYDCNPRTIKTHTTTNHLYWDALFAAKTQLGLPLGRACNNVVYAQCNDIAVALHSSCPNNTSFNMFSGKRYSDQEIADIFANIFPERSNDLNVEKNQISEKNTKEKRKEEPLLWLTFAEDLPIQTTFNNNCIEIVLRLTEFENEGKQYPELTIRVTYEIVKTSQGFVLRKKEVDARPGNLEPGQTIPARYQAIRSIILKRMENLLKPEYVIGALDTKNIVMRAPRDGDNLTTPQKERMRLQSGYLVPVTFSTANNWLNIGFKFVLEKNMYVGK